MVCPKPRKELQGRPFPYIYIYGWDETLKNMYTSKIQYSELAFAYSGFDCHPRRKQLSEWHELAEDLDSPALAVLSHGFAKT